jgi:ubiquinone/menaquinone biosynthesis C-methylase UbiE
VYHEEVEMQPPDRERLGAYLGLLGLHRGDGVTAYDAAAEAYDGFARVWDDHIAAPALAQFNTLVAQHLRPGASVLDAGAGTGERTRVLLRHGAIDRVVALDGSHAMLALAERKLRDPRVAFVRGDVTRLPFPDNSFDLVASTWVVETLDDPRSAVREFVRVLRPKGIAVYAFCSLPEGIGGALLKRVIELAAPDSGPFSVLLPEPDRPFHQCERSSLRQFSGGLTTVAVVAKCCVIEPAHLPCKLP